MASDTAEFGLHKEKVLTGMVLAIDPSSGSYNRKTREQSHLGYALFKAGELVDSGIIAMDGKNKTIWERLRDLHDCLSSEFEAPDVLVIEKLRGAFAHDYLKWSVGVIGTAIRAPVTLEMNISTWKSRAGKDYVKSDEADAIWIGRALLKICRDGV